MSYLTKLQFPTSYQDSFGRLRVSQPSMVFDSNFYTGKQAYEWDELLQGGATSTWTQGAPSVFLSGPILSRAVRQTRRYVPYYPGKSYLSFLTGTLATALGTPADADLSRIGLFDDATDVTVGGATAASAGNGFFFELDRLTLNVVARTRIGASGGLLATQADTKVAQSAWNLDKLDGKGASGYTLDPTRRQIFVIGVAWLGTGDVYMGVMSQNQIIWCHRFANAGAAGVGAYNARGSLPARYEVVVASATGRTLVHTCTAVLCEGEFEPYAPRARILTASSVRTGVNVTNVETAVLAIRFKTGRVRATLTPLSFGAAIVAGQPYLLRLYRFIAPAAYGTDTALFGAAGAWTPVNQLTVASTPSFTEAASGGVSVAEVNTTVGGAALALNVTGATFPYVRLAETYLSASLDEAVSALTDRVNTLASSIAGSSDYLVLSAQNVTAAAATTVFGVLRWVEYE